MIRRSLCISILLLALAYLLNSCDKLRGITTIYGTVTEPGVGPVDSVKVSFFASRGFIQTTYLTTVWTNENGKYEVTVDVPRGYSQVECYIPMGDNPKFSNVYRVIEVYQDGKKVNTCCSVTAGWKANFDFKLFK